MQCSFILFLYINKWLKVNNKWNNCFVMVTVGCLVWCNIGNEFVAKNVTLSGLIARLVGIARGRSCASALRCDLHNPVSTQIIGGTEKPNSLRSLQNAQRVTENLAVTVNERESTQTPGNASAKDKVLVRVLAFPFFSLRVKASIMLYGSNFWAHGCWYMQDWVLLRNLRKLRKFLIIVIFVNFAVLVDPFSSPATR